MSPDLPTISSMLCTGAIVLGSLHPFYNPQYNRIPGNAHSVYTWPIDRGDKKLQAVVKLYKSGVKRQNLPAQRR